MCQQFYLCIMLILEEERKDEKDFDYFSGTDRGEEEIQCDG